MTAKNVTYSAASGETIYAGLPLPSIPVTPSGDQFDSVVIASESSDGTPGNTASKILVVQLHGSSGQNISNGRQFDAAVSGLLAAPDNTPFRFSTVLSTDSRIYLLRPIDNYPYNASTKKESMWLGWKNMPTADVRLITVRRLNAMMAWAMGNLAFVARKTCLTGGSMGGWGSATYGLRHPELFAAVYPDRPRWRYGNGTTPSVGVGNWTGGIEYIPVADAPTLTPEDGGGSVADYMNMIAYASNPANKLPWIGWVCGKGDGYMPWQDHVDMVAALRAAKRAFAFAWNSGGHSTGPAINVAIRNSYPYGTFEIGKGYPLFTEHSLDRDPAVDAEGKINGDLSFRNVVETASGWSCEVTSVAASCTVKVEPISDVFKAAVTPQLVTIPAANTWVPVSFSA